MIKLPISTSAGKPLGIVDYFKLADRLVDQIRSQYPISCYKGCSHCCRIPNLITISEARYIVENENIPSQEEISKHILLEDALIYQGRQDDYCIRVSPEVRKCLFLEDDLCSIYKSRPLSCRGNLVITDPKLCDTSWPYVESVVGYVDSSSFTQMSLCLSMDIGTIPGQLRKVLESKGLWALKKETEKSNAKSKSSK